MSRTVQREPTQCDAIADEHRRSFVKRAAFAVLAAGITVTVASCGGDADDDDDDKDDD